MTLLLANWRLIAVLLAVSALLSWGLYWRGEYRELKADNAVLEGKVAVLTGQIAVLANGVEACNAGVAAAKRAAADVLKTSEGLLTEAKRLHAGGRETVKAMEDLLKQKPPARPDGKPANCDDAWERIETTGAP